MELERGCENEVKKAIALNPGFPTAHMLYCNMLRHFGRADESIAQGMLAVEVDPLSMLTNQLLGDAYANARRYDLAVAQFQKGLELSPQRLVLAVSTGVGLRVQRGVRQRR